MTITTHSRTLPRRTTSAPPAPAPSTTPPAPIAIAAAQSADALITPTSPAKPLPDSTDLLIMSSLDTKPPPAPPGTSDLLDALVQDHLTRATEPSDVAAPASDAAAPDVPTMTALSSDERAAMLHREIESLLSGSKDAAITSLKSVADGILQTVADAGESAPPMPIEPALSSSPMAQRSPAPDSIANESLSVDQLDALLTPALPGNETEETITAAPLPEDAPPESIAVLPSPLLDDPKTPASSDHLENLSNVLLPTDAGSQAISPDLDEGEQKMAEAEGVLAAELAQLMQEKPEVIPAAPLGAASTATAEKPATAPTANAESTQTSPSAPEPTAAKPAEIVTQAPASPAAASADPSSKEAAVAANAKIVQALTPTKSNQPQNGFVSNVASDLALMIAQLIDLPFSWVGELDKNILGVAAFMLLLSGGVLKLIAWWLG